MCMIQHILMYPSFTKARPTMPAHCTSIMVRTYVYMERTYMYMYVEYDICTMLNDQKHTLDKATWFLLLYA